MLKQSVTTGISLRECLKVGKDELLHTMEVNEFIFNQHTQTCKTEATTGIGIDRKQ